MEKQIKFYCGNEEEGSTEILNELKSEQKVLELFETQEITEISITYKKREPACTASLDTEYSVKSPKTILEQTIAEILTTDDKHKAN